MSGLLQPQVGGACVLSVTRTRGNHAAATPRGEGGGGLHMQKLRGEEKWIVRACVHG